MIGKTIIMLKILFNQNLAQNSSVGAYNAFYDKITRLVTQNRGINMDLFCKSYGKLANTFNEEKRIPEFTKLSKKLMEFLISKDINHIAGIICSVLMKLNKDNANSKLIEDLATRGLAIAKRTKDVVHIAARANDLNYILRHKNPGSEKHLKCLQIQNEALKDICKNYDGDLVNRHQTINRELAPLENYEIRLIHVKLDIAQYTLLKNPKYAIYEFEEAKALFEKNKTKYAPRILEIAEKRIKGFEEKIERLICMKNWV